MTALILTIAAAVLVSVAYCLYSDWRENRKIEARRWAEEAARRQL
jgi:hypothetical protein